MCRRRAFTLVELLVVIGIIAILISVLLPTLSRARESANRAQCLSNLKTLTTAWIMYAQENKQSLVWGGTRDVTDPSLSTDKDYPLLGWVLDVPGTQGTVGAVKDGAMYKYLKTAEVYRCPSSIDKFNFRSYSINTHLNGERALASNYDATTKTVLAPRGTSPIVTKLTQVKPTRIVFIEEYDTRPPTGGGPGETSYNQGSFFNWKLTGTGTGFDNFWGDVPAFFHQKGSTMSFADGHAEFKLWNDPRTFKAQRFGIPPPPAAAYNQPNNNDMRELKQALYGT